MSVHRAVDTHLRWAGLLHGVTLHLRNCVGDQLCVKLKTDGSDVTALDFAQNRSRPTNLEVAQGQLKPRSKVGCFTNRLKTPMGLLGERLVCGVKQIGICPLTGTPNS